MIEEATETHDILSKFFELLYFRQSLMVFSLLDVCKLDPYYQENAKSFSEVTVNHSRTEVAHQVSVQSATQATIKT
jgi:hypothetical protein